MTGVNKGCGMWYSVCGMMHIIEPLLLIGKSSPCGSSGFPHSLSDWSVTICFFKRSAGNLMWHVFGVFCFLFVLLGVFGSFGVFYHAFKNF